MLHICHIITDLSIGGAEVVLTRLLEKMPRDRFNHRVVSLTSDGPLGDRLRALGVPVHALGMRPGVPSPFLVLRLAGWLGRWKPDIVQTWMYHSDLIGGLAGWYAGVPVLWNLRNSNLDTSRSRSSTRLVVQLCARISHSLPVKIVSCAHSAASLHANLGYAAGKMVVIPNGFDLDAYQPDSNARKSVRSELGIPVNTPLVGMVARFDPQKDHHTFIQAVERVAWHQPGVHYLLCGLGVDLANPYLAEWITSAGVKELVHLLGRREDLQRLYAALDVLVSSSAYGEAFPNVVGEAMACGVPCVVTDVGDSARIVGDTGRVVQPGQPDALAAAIESILSLSKAGRTSLGSAARDRISMHYTLSDMAAQYATLYEGIR